MSVENAMWVDEIWWEGNKRLQWSLMKGKQQFHLAKLKKEKKRNNILYSDFYILYSNFKPSENIKRKTKSKCLPENLDSTFSLYVELMP